MFEENFIPISPLPFFQVHVDCLHVDLEKGAQIVKRQEYALPSMEKITGEVPFAKLHMGWNQEGLYFFCDVTEPFQDVFYPDIARGDSLEIFINTRNIKQGGFITKFCHHFFFFPKEVDGRKCGEVTHFRTEDAHELADSKQIHLKSEIQKKGYHLNIFIPSQIIHGYDPDQFNRLGFTYRVNRCNKPSQHFTSLSGEFKLEQQLSEWGSINLIHENSAIRKTSKSKS